MKQRSAPLLAAAMGIFLLGGCASFSELYVNTTDKFGLTPEYAKGLREEAKPRADTPLGTPSFTVGDDVPEGPYVAHNKDGKVIKTVIVNRCFDEYVDIYYPNGQLQVHTPMVNCKSEGLSKGYTPEGILKTEIPYKNGWMDGEVRVFNPQGEVVRRQTFSKGLAVTSPNLTITQP